MNKTAISINNGFSTILLEGRTQEKLGDDKGIDFHNITGKTLFKEHKTQLYCTNFDLKAVIIEI